MSSSTLDRSGVAGGREAPAVDSGPGGRGDVELLRAWEAEPGREGGGAEALGELVRRRVGMVFAAARRQLGAGGAGDSGLAEDVTQAVFILLLRKSRGIRTDAELGRWLFATTRYAAANAGRAARRRRRNEAKSAMMSSEIVVDDPAGLEAGEREALLRGLDEAIARLPGRDRDCVVLSFLEGRSHREVGEAVGISEEAARKRIGRALEKMRKFFSRRGIRTEAGVVAVVLAGAGGMEGIGTHAAEAAGGGALGSSSGALAESVVRTAVSAHLGSLNHGSAIAIAKGASHMAMMSKVKLAALVAAVVLGTGAIGTEVVRSVFAGATVGRVEVAGEGRSPDSYDLGDGVRVDVVGISAFADKGKWWGLDGTAREVRDFSPEVSSQTEPQPMYRMLLEVEMPADAAVRQVVRGSDATSTSSTISGPGKQRFEIAFRPRGETVVAPGGIKVVEAMKLEVEVATGPWERLQNLSLDGGAIGGADYSIVSGSLATSAGGKPQVFVATTMSEKQWTVVAILKNGAEVVGTGERSYSTGNLAGTEMTFEVPPDEIQSLEMRVRAYGKKIVIDGVTVDPAKPVTPKVQMVK